MSLTFLSTAVEPMTEKQLWDLVLEVRPKNEARGITGVMLYSDRSFIETIEGPEDAVDRTMAKIARDPRHRGVFVALRDHVSERAYPDWSMGFRSLSAAELASLPGYSDYMNVRRSLVDRGERPTSQEVFHRVFRDAWRYPSPES